MQLIKKRLLKEANIDYKNFSQKIMPDAENMLGVKIPILHKIAKEIYNTQDWQSFLRENPQFWEELMLQAFVIGLVKDKPENILQYVKDFIPKLNGWGVCDGFCASLKFTKNNKKLVWKFIQPYFLSDKEYEIRFAYVMLLTYFVDVEYIDKSLSLIDKFKDDRYYAKMAVAWALSICYIKFPTQTLKYLKVSKLSQWTYNKAIQKICESLRVNVETKKMLKTLKK